MAVKVIDSEWEEMMVEECGLGVRPYVMSTAGPIGELEWLAEDVRASLRDFLADPVGTSASSLEDFLTKTAGSGEPDQPSVRQKHAWPARDIEERPHQEETPRGKK